MATETRVDPGDANDPAHRLRLMTYNMQVGIRTRHVGDYLTQSWRHLLPPVTRTRHLEPMARMLQGQDLVAIQEGDAGSFRTRSVNLLHFLAERADYPYWHLHRHRNFAPVARHAMGLLSRFQPTDVEAHPLPGRVSGRAAVIYRLAPSLAVVVTHLALGRADRHRQLHHIGGLVGGDEHVILMGDLNCEPEELHAHPLLRERGFQSPEVALHSFPSWRPSRQLDHVLVTPGFCILTAEATPFGWSDHLPVSVEVALPRGIALS